MLQTVAQLNRYNNNKGGDIKPPKRNFNDYNTLAHCLFVGMKKMVRKTLMALPISQR